MYHSSTVCTYLFNFFYTDLTAPPFPPGHYRCKHQSLFFFTGLSAPIDRKEGSKEGGKEKKKKRKIFMAKIWIIVA